MKINDDICLHGKLKGPLAIKALKRFVTERDTGKWKQFSRKLAATGMKVAIIGSGPAGLTAACYLAKSGHSVTVFEALSQPGGMMRVGIPDYRLPKDILDIEIKEICDTGVEIKLNSKVTTPEELFSQGYVAIFLAVGAHRGIKLDIAGADSPGVIDGATFLKKVNLGEKIKIGNNIAIIGGGNTAIDSARTAIRLGARNVQIIYRRSQDEMPADHNETQDGVREGVKLSFLTAPVSINGANGHLKLTCNRMTLGETDESGRKRPIPIKGSEFETTFDTIIAAIGQTTDIPEQFSTKRDLQILQIDYDTMRTGRENIWAGGDVVSGPASVISAISAGRKAASDIDKYLGGSGNIEEQLIREARIVKRVVSDDEDNPRVKMIEIPPDNRKDNFNEVETGLGEEAAVAESKRCLQCDDGVVSRCQYSCPAGINIPLYLYLISEGKYEDALAVIREKVPFPRVLGRICTAPCEESCTSCALCVPYCPVNAISETGKEGQMFINQDECVECGSCLRAETCPIEALWQPELEWPRVLRAQFSDPCVFHPTTQVSGRGTEESKTNDVTGRYPRGYVCIAVELGRPGIGTKMKEVEKVAQAVLPIGVEFESDNPTFQLFTDLNKGKLRKDVLEEKVLSAILEFKVITHKAPEVLQALERVAREIETVISVNIGSMMEPNGDLPAEIIARESGFKIRPNGKNNLGLGLPHATVEEVTPK
ncbi:FAD-dependent oxidoreductase [Chloroflexota bacterium]